MACFPIAERESLECKREFNAMGEFEKLVADLSVVDQIRKAADLPLAKSLTLDSARKALAKLDRPARRGPFFTELRPAPRQVPRQPVKVDVRAKVRAAVPELLAKAMDLFSRGAITAEQVSRIEARVHHLLASAR